MATNLANATIIADDHTVKRTIGAHLGDVFNVKGFGALGNGSDDTTKIQAAADACIAAGGGTVYFPMSSGNYIISAPITFNNDSEVGIRFLGEANNTSKLYGNFNGFLLDRRLGTPNNTKATRIIERMYFHNPHSTGGCVRIGSSVGAVIRNCFFNGHVGVTTEDSVGVSSTNTHIQDCLFNFPAVSFTGCNGIIIGGGGSITGSDVHGGNVGIRAYGSGLHIGSGRIERCATAILCGVDSADTDVGLSGFAIASYTFEGNWTSVDFVGTCSGFFLGEISIIGHDASNAGPSGLTGSPAAKGVEYGIRIRADKGNAGLLHGIGAGNYHDIACYSIANSTARANMAMIGCTDSQSGVGAGVGFSLPTEAHTLKVIECKVAPVYLYADLSSSPLEGEEHNISDCTTPTWGATAAGGGTDNVLVRYNGTNWTVVGK